MRKQQVLAVNNKVQHFPFRTTMYIYKSFSHLPLLFPALRTVEVADNLRVPVFTITA